MTQRLNAISSLHYDFKHFPGSSHWLLIRAIRRNPKWSGALLDIGAAGGELASFLAEDFDRLIGVEGDPARVEALSRYFDQAFVADLNHLERLPAAAAVIMGDVLEHLPRAGPLLRLVRDSIAPDGRLYVSVPNIANVTVRLSLLFGRWSYADRGILDRTHLRFYTRRTIEAELREHGFEPVKIEATTMPIRLVLEGRLPAAAIRFGERLLLATTAIFPALLGYQWVITARPV
ncbi:MAG: class I SAM-dependent methyltransferase [Acidobacteria bacterium]|nr:class I SAM-dependent methyltransferase [Acidobacteriota bacterium]